MDRVLPPGRHDARLDGRATSGPAASSGICDVRIESAELGGTRKVVRIEYRAGSERAGRMVRRLGLEPRTY